MTGLFITEHVSDGRSIAREVPVYVPEARREAIFTPDRARFASAPASTAGAELFLPSVRAIEKKHVNLPYFLMKLFEKDRI
jgi:hypothetical protein